MLQTGLLPDTYFCNLESPIKPRPPEPFPSKSAMVTVFIIPTLAQGIDLNQITFLRADDRAQISRTWCAAPCNRHGWLQPLMRGAYRWFALPSHPCFSCVEMT